jgi:uncharacterized membrane protein YccC
MDPQTSGSTLNKSILRVVGTVFGAFAGYLMILFLGDSQIATIAVFVGWVLLAGYVRSNERMGYAGAVAAINAALVIFGIPRFSATPAASDIAFSRIQATLVGIMVVMFMNIVWPCRSSDLLKASVLSIIQKAVVYVRRIFGGLVEHASPISIEQAATEFTGLRDAVKAQVGSELGG